LPEGTFNQTHARDRKKLRFHSGNLPEGPFKHNPEFDVEEDAADASLLAGGTDGQHNSARPGRENSSNSDNTDGKFSRHFFEKKISAKIFMRRVFSLEHGEHYAGSDGNTPQASGPHRNKASKSSLRGYKETKVRTHPRVLKEGLHERKAFDQGYLLSFKHIS
jgi:hypothetical protein